MRMCYNERELQDDFVNVRHHRISTECIRNSIKFTLRREVGRVIKIPLQKLLITSVVHFEKYEGVNFHIL